MHLSQAMMTNHQVEGKHELASNGG